MTRYIIQYVASQTAGARAVTAAAYLAENMIDAQYQYSLQHAGHEIISVSEATEADRERYGLGYYTQEEQQAFSSRRAALRSIEADSAQQVKARISACSLEEFAARVEYQQRRASSTTQNAEGVFVGDLFRHEWGYDQTNVDYYQVVGLKGKHTILVKRLNEKRGEVLSENGIATMTGYSRPIRDSFRGEETYTLRTKTSYGLYIRAPRESGGCLMPAKDGELYDWTAYA